MAALFGGAIGKDIVGRVWRKVKADWEAWNERDPGGEDIVRLSMGGESAAAWQAFLEDMTARGLKVPQFIIVDGAPGLEATLLPCGPMCRSSAYRPQAQTVAGPCPKRMHDGLTEDCRDMIHAETAAEIGAKRRSFRRT